MSRSRNARSQFKSLGVVPISGDKEPATRGDPPAFDGTIVSACESVGISLEQMIEMMRWARESDPKVAQFLDTWDALDPSERRVRGTAEAIRQRVGLKLLELLGFVADATYRAAMYQAQIIAAVTLPRVVQKLVDSALDDGDDTRMEAATLLSKATGFLPTPKGSQTTISIMQNAQANAAAQSGAVVAPPPEQTIRRLVDRWNASRGLPHAPPRVLSEVAIGVALPISIPENGDAVPVEVPKEEENDGE